MTLNSKDARLENLNAARGQLLDLLAGMDYCLDWKPEPADWSVRQVTYHLLESPPGGIHHVIWGAVSGELEDFEVSSGVDNITPERSSRDLEQIVEDVDRFFTAAQEALEAAGDRDLEEKSVLARDPASGVDHPFTLGGFFEVMLGAHWNEHLAQIRALRDALGM